MSVAIPKSGSARSSLMNPLIFAGAEE